MRFLVDAQLPPALARQIELLGHTAEHVADSGRAKAADNVIRAYAAETGAVIVTKDEDFAVYRVMHEGPAVVLGSDRRTRDGLSCSAALQPNSPQSLQRSNEGKRSWSSHNRWREKPRVAGCGRSPPIINGGRTLAHRAPKADRKTFASDGNAHGLWRASERPARSCRHPRMAARRSHSTQSAAFGHRL